jgi:hypothetical protein
MKPRHQCAPAVQRWLVWVGWLFCITLFLTSCSERAQEMEEKVTQLQRQLDQTQKQLQAANQALASRKQEEPVRSSESSAGLPSRDALEQSYSSRVSAFRKELDASLKDFRIESCTVHSVQMPAEFYPFTSQLSLAFVSTDGKNFTTDIPVKADASGKWVFPTVAEVTQRIENARRTANGTAPSTSTAQRQTGTSSEQPAPIMKVDGTFVVQWPNSNAPTATARPTSPSASAPVPAASAAPPPVTAASPPRTQTPPPGTAAPVMPVDRDVQIQFPP